MGIHTLGSVGVEPALRSIIVPMTPDAARLCSVWEEGVRQERLAFGVPQSRAYSGESAGTVLGPSPRHCHMRLNRRFRVSGKCTCRFLDRRMRLE